MTATNITAITAPSDQELLQHNFNPLIPVDGVHTHLTNDEYRASPGIAPSDIKIASEDIGGAKGRGHLYRLANDRRRRWCRANNFPLPPGLEEPKPKKVFEIGTIYHAMLMEPDKFKDEFLVMDQATRAELVAKRQERKLRELPTEFNARWKESTDAKKANGGKDLSPGQKADILQQRQREYRANLGDFSEKSIEFIQWSEAARSAGKKIISATNLRHAEAMIDALHNLPENGEVGEIFGRMMAGSGRVVEPSLYLHQEFANERYPSLQLKGRPDLMNDDFILDPKTCVCAHPEVFGKQVETYGYDLSMAAYYWMARKLAGHPDANGLNFPKKRVGFLAQEKTPPYLARIYWLPDEWLRFKIREYELEIQAMSDVWGRGRWSKAQMEAGEQTLMPSNWLQKQIEMM